jgi:protein-tyrosine phosphatase
MHFVDIHGHYAWDIDDGVKNKEEAIEVLKLAKKNNIEVIVATVHLNSGENKKEFILERIQELRKLASQYNIKVIDGCELMLNDKINETLDNDLVIPINHSKYVLCEYSLRKSERDFVEEFDSYLLGVISNGYIPVIAHIERYFYDALDIEYIQYLIDLGCVIQINTTSILGLGHIKHKKYALQLLDKNMVHVIASDTHSMKSHRQPNMKECCDYLIKLGYDKEYIKVLLKDNPINIIKNKDVIQPHYKKRSMFKKLMYKVNT